MEELTIEQQLSLVETALREAHRDYCSLRRGVIPHSFLMEAGTQACEGALAALDDLRAHVQLQRGWNDQTTGF